MTVAELFAEERERFEREHPRSRALADRMAPMSPATTEADVDRHTEVFDSLAARLGTLSG